MTKILLKLTPGGAGRAIYYLDQAGARFLILKGGLDVEIYEPNIKLQALITLLAETNKRR